MSVFTLLSFGAPSDAFSSTKTTVKDEGSASHGTIRIQITGDHATFSPTAPTQVASDNRDLSTLRRAIRIILTRNAPEELPDSYERIYNTCRSIVCVSGKGEGLYDTLKLELEQCIDRLANELTGAVSQPSNGWTKLLVSICKWFETELDLLQSLLSYLNQLYIKKDKQLHDIQNLAYGLFVHRIFGHFPIAQRVEKALADWLNHERVGRMVDLERRELISRLVSHLITHGQYAAFEEHYLTLTRSYCQEESAARAEALKKDPKGFFAHVRSRIDDEISRAKAVLSSGSLGAVQREVEIALLENQLEWLSAGTVTSYIDAEDFETLDHMYRMFSRVNGIKALCMAFKQYVQTSVERIVKDQANDDTMIERLRSFKARAGKAIHTVFTDDSTLSSNDASGSTAAAKPNQDFVYASNDAFTAGFKARRNKPAEMLAKYLDKTLRKGQGSMSDEAFAALLDDALSLYKFTDDRDVFRTFYHRQLAKRLLLGRSASDDFEKALLKKLKEGYDPELGSAEEMFTDLGLSRDLINEYHKKLPTNSQVNLMVWVLKSSAWPFATQKETIDLPRRMQDEITQYTAFYKTKHANRDLKFDHALGTATMVARFKLGTKELSVSLFQAVVLLLFNDADEVAFTDIKAQTRIEDGELRRTLQSLACGKKKVLRKVPPGKEVEDGDVFRFNADFDDPRAKVHINSIQAKVSAEESKRTQNVIEGERKHALDAAIVRIMKAKKSMKYELLKTATIHAVKNHFVPQVDAIKKRIDALVEQEYLKRDPEDKNLFSYVA